MKLDINVHRNAHSITVYLTCRSDESKIDLKFDRVELLKEDVFSVMRKVTLMLKEAGFLDRHMLCMPNSHEVYYKGGQIVEFLDRDFPLCPISNFDTLSCYIDTVILRAREVDSFSQTASGSLLYSD